MKTIVHRLHSSESVSVSANVCILFPFRKICRAFFLHLQVHPFRVMTPCLAVIEADVLAAAGFRSLLGDLFFGAEILVYPSVEAFVADSNRYFVHFFVRDSLLFAK